MHSDLSRSPECLPNDGNDEARNEEPSPIVAVPHDLCSLFFVCGLTCQMSRARRHAQAGQGRRLHVDVRRQPVPLS